MCLAEHLAVALVRSSALAPSQHMVGIHVFQCPNFVLVGIMPTGAERTIALMLFLGRFRLTAVNAPLSVVIEYTHVKQLCVFATAKHILEHVFVVLNARVIIKLPYPLAELI